jgi:5-methylcytosine-specific restriction enzyme A
MPRALKVCAEPGCPELTPGRRCDDHAPKPWASSTRRHNVASGWQQQRERDLVLKRDRGICHWCGQPGADQVDHVIAVANGGPDTPANKAPIHSKPCHVEKTVADRRARA